MDGQAKHQVISDEKGNPLFVLVPYCEYVSFYGDGTEAFLPNRVASLMATEGHNILRAWRKYLKLSQKEVAERIGVTQGAYCQMENTPDSLRRETLQKISQAMGIPYDFICTHL